MVRWVEVDLARICGLNVEDERVGLRLVLLPVLLVFAFLAAWLVFAFLMGALLPISVGISASDGR